MQTLKIVPVGRLNAFASLWLQQKITDNKLLDTLGAKGISSMKPR